MQRGNAAPDRGVCLSMHQPWASLLVYGLKRIEGRGWPSDHRGRWAVGSGLEALRSARQVQLPAALSAAACLPFMAPLLTLDTLPNAALPCRRLWIASTVQPPSPQDIEVSGCCAGLGWWAVRSAREPEQRHLEASHSKWSSCIQHVQELEAFYRTVHAADAGAAPGISAEVQLPPAYPTGVLLGCVEVVDIVTVRASASRCCLGELLQALHAAGLLSQPSLTLEKLRRTKRHNVRLLAPLHAAGLP